MPVVTCHTEECGNQDEAIELDESLRPVDDDGAPVADGEWLIACGVCGQLIASVTYAQEAGT